MLLLQLRSYVDRSVSRYRNRSGGPILWAVILRVPVECMLVRSHPADMLSDVLRMAIERCLPHCTGPGKKIKKRFGTSAVTYSFEEET